MKKIFLLLLIAVSIGASAQQKFSLPNYYGGNYGTYTNTNPRAIPDRGWIDSVLATLGGGSSVHLTKSGVWEFPSASDKPYIFRTPVAITIDSVNVVLAGSGTISADYQLQFGADITSLTNVFTTGNTVSSTSTGTTVTTGFSNASIPAGNHLQLYLSGVSGSVTQFRFTIYYHEN